MILHFQRKDRPSQTKIHGTPPYMWMLKRHTITSKLYQLTGISIPRPATSVATRQLNRLFRKPSKLIWNQNTKDMLTMFLFISTSISLERNTVIPEKTLTSSTYHSSNEHVFAVMSPNVLSLRFQGLKYLCYQLLKETPTLHWKGFVCTSRCSWVLPPCRVVTR